MKVINITEEGRYGGPQSRITKVAGILNDMGIKTTVICSVIDSDILLDELKKNRVSFITIRLHRMTLELRHLIGYVFFFLPEILSLKRIILKNKADVIHCNGSWQIKGMIAARLAGTEAQVVYHLNDTNNRRIIKSAFSLLASRWVDAFIPASQRSRDYYLNDSLLKAKKSYIIPAPVDTDKFNPDTVAADISIKKLPGTKIITVCNINYGKGLEELIELCSELSRRFPLGSLSFCVVGPVHRNHESYFEELKNRIRGKRLENFFFQGASNNVPAALKAADIYICASRFESSPMAVWEAMSMRLPVVSTDVGDVKYHLEQGRCGFCVPVGNMEKMEDRISILIADKAMCAEMGRNGRDYVVKNLDLKICAEKHACFYQMVASKKKAKKEVK